MTTLGSPAWIERTRGAMTSREKAAMARQVITAFASGLPARLTWRLTDGAKILARLDLDSTPPDSALVRKTSEFVSQTHDPWLVGHCVRTWAFGRLFAQVDGLAVDDEALYVASMLHDVALTETYRISGADSCQCFAVHGAHLAKETLSGFGADESMATTVRDAIGWHLNAVVPEAAGPEAVALNAGAALDVVGLRASAIGRAAAAQVVSDEPRDGFVDGLVATLRVESRARPDARIGLLWRLGFGPAIRSNPLNGLS